MLVTFISPSPKALHNSTNLEDIAIQYGSNSYAATLEKLTGAVQDT